MHAYPASVLWAIAVGMAALCWSARRAGVAAPARLYPYFCAVGVAALLGGKLHSLLERSGHLHALAWELQNGSRYPGAIIGLVLAVWLMHRRTGLAGYRARYPLALAEHFYYPHAPWMDARFRHNLAAAITRTAKVIRRRDGTEYYDLERDPDETTPVDGRVPDLTAGCRREWMTDAAISPSLADPRSWSA